MPALPSPRRVAGGGRETSAPAIPSRDLLGAAAAGLRRSDRPARPRRSRPGRARRQSHRSPLHRRRVGRLSLPGAPRRRPREPSRLAARRRRPAALGRPPDRGLPLRAAREPADPRGVRAVPPVSRAGARPRRPSARRRRARSARVRRMRAGPLARCGDLPRAALRPRRPRSDRGARALRVVPPEPAEHLHGEIDAADAAERSAKGDAGGGERDLGFGIPDSGSRELRGEETGS